MCFYPLAYFAYSFGYKPYSERQAELAKQAEWDNLPEARTVDRDIFNPFTPIPYHNNEQLTYALEGINMFGYLNENHINVKDYPYKQYHNLYDHDDKGSYTYNWVSINGPDY